VRGDRIEELEGIQEMGVTIGEGSREEGWEEGDVVLHDRPGVKPMVTVKDCTKGENGTDGEESEKKTNR
jgi:hypothetical protein